MRRIFADLSDSEALAFYKDKKPNETIREYMLRIAGVDFERRQIGRPRSTPSRIPSSLDVVQGSMTANPVLRTTSGDEARKALKDKYGEGWKKPEKPEGE